MTTVAGSLEWGRDRLKRAGIEDYSRECEILLEHGVARDRAWLHFNRDYLLPECTTARFEELVSGRSAGVPVQYLTGSCEFFGMELRVGPGVYIPKPETEGLVELALDYLETPRKLDLTWGESASAALVHDIGTGSGAIAIAIARHAPAAKIWASDASAYAISIARVNAENNSLDCQITFRRGDLQSHLSGTPELVVANLPYIDTGASADLPVEVRVQPMTSLVSQDKGLRHIDRLLQNIRIAPGGIVLLEIGSDQAASVQTLCDRRPNLRYARTVKDLAGLDRIAVIEAQ